MKSLFRSFVNILDIETICLIIGIPAILAGFIFLSPLFVFGGLFVSIVPILK